MKQRCTRIRCFSTCPGRCSEVFCQALPSQAEAMFQWDSLLADFFLSLLRVVLQPYLIQVILTALGSYPFPLFCQDISFAFSTNPSPLETAEVEAGCCCAKQTCQGRLLCWCITGAHTVRISSPKRCCVQGPKGN